MTDRRGLPSTSGPRHALVWVLAIGYGAALTAIALWPTPIDDSAAGLLRRVLSELHERGLPSVVTYVFVEGAANVLLFIPIGVLFGLALPTRWWVLMLLCGPLLSATIEIVQRQALSERYASVSDVVANAVGSTVGVLLALAVRAVVARRDAQVIARHKAEIDLIDSRS